MRPPSAVYTLLKPAKLDGWELKRVIYPKQSGGFEYWTSRGMRRIQLTSQLRGVVLSHNEDVWMSDTPLEVTTAQPFVDRAYGDVLEVGLGIGLTLSMLKKVEGRIRSITVVEKEQAVADLIYDSIKFDKTRLVISSIEAFVKQPQWHHKFDAIHFDIWPTRNQALVEVTRVKKLCEPLLKPDGFTYVWLEELSKLVGDALKKGATISAGAGLYPPCFSCGKVIRNDYYGLCMDCADCLGLSEFYMDREKLLKLIGKKDETVTN